MPARILLVDDEPEFLDAHVNALENAGYVVQQAYTYHQAVTALKTPQYDLFILDILLPDESQVGEIAQTAPDDHPGIKLARYIRKELLLKQPIIFLSVMDDTEIPANARKLIGGQGANLNFITKPALPSKLLTAVRKALGE